MELITIKNTDYNDLEQICTEIIDFWFPNHISDHYSAHDFWFDQSPDKYIFDKYKYLIDTIRYYNISNIYNLQQKLALIIVGDQFTRNVYRNDEYNRKKNDEWVLQLAINIINSDNDLILNLNQRYFILLPLRHQNKSYLLDRVMSRINIYLNEFKDNIPTSLIKFLSHTLCNYTYLDDQNILSTKITSYNCDQMIAFASNKIYNHIIDTNFFTYSKNYQINNMIKSFKDVTKINYIYNCVYEWVKSFGKSNINIGISLSGGVDSMVLLSCLVQIKFVEYSLIDQIIAVHIEHTNRIEGKIEREFLEEFCAILNIKFYYRTIYYMNRDTLYIDRDLYESETKKIRFNLYSFVVNKYHLIGICIGHHLGDITENIFCNIIKGKPVDNLGVMKIFDLQEDINIFRPMLNQIKDNIFEYANIYNIPYFINSTPVWSCRGVLRDQVIPILKKQFGNFEPNIKKLMSTCEEMANLNNKYIIQPYLDKIKIYDENIAFRIEYNQDLILETIWDKILINFAHFNGYHMISNKSKNNFLQWLKIIRNKDKTNFQYDLGKNMFAFVDINIQYVYLINYTKIKKQIEEFKSKSINLSHFNNLEYLLNQSFDESKPIIVIPQKIKKLFN